MAKLQATLLLNLSLFLALAGAIIAVGGVASLQAVRVLQASRGQAVAQVAVFARAPLHGGPAVLAPASGQRGRRRRGRSLHASCAG